MKRLLILSVTASLIFSLLMLFAMPVGAALDPPSVLLSQLATCDYQCWAGIIVGETSYSDAEDVLYAMGYRQGARNPLLGGGGATAFITEDCVTTLYYSALIESIHFLACREIALGDILLMLGTPDAIIYRQPFNYELRWARYPGLFIHMDNWSTPHAPLRRLTLSNPIEVSRERNRETWRGMMPVALYCAIEQPVSAFGC